MDSKIPNNSNNPDQNKNVVPVSKVRLAFLEGLRESAEKSTLTHKQFAEAVLGKYDTQFKAIHSMVNSPSFQYMLENVRRTQEAVQKMAETILPVVKDVERNTSFVENMRHQDELSIPAYQPQRDKVIVKEQVVEKVVVIREGKSSLSDEEIQAIIKQASERTAEVMIKEIRKEQKKYDATQLFLTLSGDLYREPKDKYNYPMRDSLMTQGIVRFLAEAASKDPRRYTETKTIQEFVQSKSPESVRGAIKDINNMAKQNLKIKEKLIDSKYGYGYRVNPIYKIEILDTY